MISTLIPTIDYYYDSVYPLPVLHFVTVYNSVVLCPSWRIFQHAVLNNMGCPWYKLKATLKHDIANALFFVVQVLQCHDDPRF